jgi:hypothetical protein
MPDTTERSDADEPVDSHRDLIKPDKQGLIPLFDAVYWIASEGHTKTVDTASWDNAARVVIVALHGRRLAATGTLRGTHTPQKIPAEDWQGVVVDRMNMEPHLLLIGPAREHDLHGGEYQDQLFMESQWVSTWWRLAVEKSDIRRLWPPNIEVADSCGERVGPGEKQRETEASARKNLSGNTRSIGGAPPKYDWGEVELFVFRTLNDRGDFAHYENQQAGWRSQADLVRLAQDHLKKLCEKENPGAVDAEDKVPADSTSKSRIGPMIAKWRSGPGR